MGIICVCWLCCVQTAAAWPFGGSKEKRKEEVVMELLREPTRLMNEAQDAEADGRGEAAVAQYREALEQLQMIEKAQDTTGTEFAPLRFKRAMCETMIDRILFDKAEKFERTVTVSDTSSLYQRLQEERAVAASNELARAQAAEQAARSNELVTAAAAAASAESNRVATVAEPVVVAKPEIKPEPKPEPEAEPVHVAEPAEPAEPPAAAKPTAMPAEPVDVAEELDWAKDLYGNERFEEAEKSLKGVLRVDPENREALMLFGAMRVRQARYEDALIALETVIDLRPQDDAAALLAAGASLGCRNYPRAMELLEGVLSRRPEDPAAYNNMAWVLVEMRNGKELELAEQYYRKGVELGGARDRALERRMGIDPK